MWVVSWSKLVISSLDIVAVASFPSDKSLALSLPSSADLGRFLRLRLDRRGLELRLGAAFERGPEEDELARAEKEGFEGRRDPIAMVEEERGFSVLVRWRERGLTGGFRRESMVCFITKVLDGRKKAGTSSGTVGLS